MAKEKVQTSQGLTELAQETETKIEQLTKEIEQEPKAIPGGSPRKARRRSLKKYLHRLEKDYLPRIKNTNKLKRSLPDATAIPRQIMMRLLCT